MFRTLQLCLELEENFFVKKEVLESIGALTFPNRILFSLGVQSEHTRWQVYRSQDQVCDDLALNNHDRTVE